jgi:6-phosphogluconate dehydrogenase
MKLGFIGLGKMGQNMVKRLTGHGHEVAAFDQSAEALKNISQVSGATACRTLDALIAALPSPRVLWLMVPAGEPVNATCETLRHKLAPGDTIIDGGNSHFWDSIKLSQDLSHQGIRFVDVGVSGGLFGVERGYCLMIGGDAKTCEELMSVWRALAPGQSAAPNTPSRVQDQTNAAEGFLYCGANGSGHYVKMVHNAIEYGMMAAFAEGMGLLKAASDPSHNTATHFNFDLKEVAEVWRRGSVIDSWLLDLLANALHKDASLKNFSGVVNDSGEGRWALMEGIRLRAPMPVLADSLFTRFNSRIEDHFLEKTLSALRNEFGGHQEPK